jgi:DNA-binding LacI/PurR family transcriptional regulator
MGSVRKKPTIATVAARAGVAVSTVSRYLNGRYVSRTVRARLSEIIEELGYTRSWTARNLSLGRRGSIGVAVDSSEDPWFVQLLKGIEEDLSTRDTSLMLCSMVVRKTYDPKIVLQWIQDHRVDGLIVAKAQRRERPLFRAARQAQVPVIAVAPFEIIAGVNVLRSNNVGGGAMVADHLVNLGHRSIAFAGGPSHSIDSKHRLRGLQEGLARRGITLAPKHIFSCESFELDAGTAFAEQFLSRPLDVTAIVLANDALAFGFMRFALRRGIKMPDELSIVGFDGLVEGAFLYPALTTAAQPMQEMGRVACQRLLESHSVPGHVERIEFPMHLIVRESTARPSAEPAKVRPFTRVGSTTAGPTDDA